MKNLIVLSLLLPFTLNAMDAKKELIESGAIIAGGAAAAYAFGKGAEWVSNAIAPEYTRYHNNTWDTPLRRSSTLINKWGFLATLWAGVPVALAARAGHHPLNAQDLIKPVAITYGATAGLAALVGAYSYMRKPDTEKAGENAMVAARITSYIAAPAGLIGYILYKRIKG